MTAVTWRRGKKVKTMRMQWVKNLKRGGHGTLVHQPGIRVEDAQMSPLSIAGLTAVHV
jgi:hypothetical protein